MGTRSLTHIHQEGRDSPLLCTFYRQMDGYPTGHGADLKACADLTLLNGFQLGQEAGTYANGMGCLAAQVVATLKANAGIGGIYLFPPDASDCDEEYVYHLYEGELQPPAVHLEVIAVGYPHANRLLYQGPLEAFDPATCEED